MGKLRIIPHRIYDGSISCYNIEEISENGVYRIPYSFSLESLKELETLIAECVGEKAKAEEG